jgi:hypothetical protein
VSKNSKPKEKTPVSKPMFDVSVTLTFRFTSDHEVNHLPDNIIQPMLGLLAAGKWGVLDPNRQVQNRRLSADDMDLTRALLEGRTPTSELIQAYEAESYEASTGKDDTPPLPVPTVEQAAESAVGKVRDAINAEKAAEAESPDAERPARQFLAEECVLDATSSLGWRPFHQLYKAWCEGNGHPILSVNDWRSLLMGTEGVTVDPDGRVVEGIAVEGG